MLLADKVAFVTGAARGQGRAHAVALARAGADVAVLDVCRSFDYPRYALATPADLDETVRLVEGEGRRALPLIADVRDFSAMAAVAEEPLSRLGRVDVVVANAGITDMAKTWDLPEAWWDAMVDVNLKGCFTTVRHLLPAMIERRAGGRVILISSVAGLRGLAGLSHYCAAKWGVVGFAKALALELAPHRITVNTVHPTNVDTPLLTGMAEAAGIPFDGFRAEIGGRNALPVDLLPPEDVAKAVLWLASEDARFVTGQELKVDAGMTLG
ncbi:MAG TPA: mycofactocin-coupled SDR family oxidoreductase [Polyangiaceae bacterium LLY-WYZ-14_1]|nr:mycofactocin-coupled SDR family oxidoreductase [Polyangiaceae bacterium LLY-WYZ-14_1]